MSRKVMLDSDFAEAAALGGILKDAAIYLGRDHIIPRGFAMKNCKLVNGTSGSISHIRIRRAGDAEPTFILCRATCEVTDFNSANASMAE